MGLSEKIAQQLPFLRRYARILTGSQSLGDSLVRELLEGAVADEEMRTEIAKSRAHLYGAFSRLYATAGLAVETTGGDYTDTVASRMNQVTPLARQAMLLHTVEDFPIGTVAQILAMSEEDAQTLIDTGTQEVDDASRSEVMIIEDEPLIALQIEDIVLGMGHTVVGIAKTHSQAVELFSATTPKLVLADIQLADGSSGIDAVNDILEQMSVPVIFITAFPERLLTGQRPEPTYLITKPFKDEHLKATIGQVTFFGSTSQLG